MKLTPSLLTAIAVGLDMGPPAGEAPPIKPRPARRQRRGADRRRRDARKRQSATRKRQRGSR